jgi:hypothetical protein
MRDILDPAPRSGATRRRVQRAIERTEPAAVPWVVAERRHDQQIARAGGGHIREPNAFRLIARHLFGLVLVQLVRRPAADLHGAQPLSRFEMTAGVVSAEAARQVREDDDGNSRPLALCTVISRTPSLLSSSIGASAASDSAAHGARR